MLARRGHDVSAFPLSAYRGLSFYTMRIDSLDCFGTRREQRFSKAEIETMMRNSGLVDIVARDEVPDWVMCGRKSSAAVA